MTGTNKKLKNMTKKKEGELVRQTAKPYKETDEVKDLLNSFKDLQDQIDYEEGRLAFLEDAADSPSSPNFSGSSGSGGIESSSKQSRDYIKREELKEKLSNLNEEESRLRELIEELIRHVKNPKQKAALEMRYLDGASWKAVNVVIHGDEPDFDDLEESYLDATYKIHGRALQSLARIYRSRKHKRE